MPEDEKRRRTRDEQEFGARYAVNEKKLFPYLIRLNSSKSESFRPVAIIFCQWHAAIGILARQRRHVFGVMMKEPE